MNTHNVTVENYEGDCKHVEVQAIDMYEAMAIAQTNGWYPVDVELA